jgi:hypothetical protein
MRFGLLAALLMLGGSGFWGMDFGRAIPSSTLGRDLRGRYFVAFRDLSGWTRELGEKPGEIVLTSGEIEAPLAWDELIVSWNLDAPAGTSLKVEARGLYPDHATKYYVLGLWSPDGLMNRRESVNGQKDADGNVLTDTLALKRPGARAQLRLTVGGPEGASSPKLKFIGLSFTDTTAAPAPLPPNRAAWGKVIDVPEVVKGVYDPNWPGTGNWPFNTAFAGAMPGLRAYVARFSDVSELEDWIAAGIPVIFSVDYNKLKANGKTDSSGHLIVCVGFTENGDIVVNDPALNPKKGKRVRAVYPRKNLMAGWGASQNTVYLIYPENAKRPRDRFRHWEGDPREAAR